MEVWIVIVLIRGTTRRRNTSAAGVRELTAEAAEVTRARLVDAEGDPDRRPAVREQRPFEKRGGRGVQPHPLDGYPASAGQPLKLDEPARERGAGDDVRREP